MRGGGEGGGRSRAHGRCERGGGDGGGGGGGVWTPADSAWIAACLCLSGRTRVFFSVQSFCAPSPVSLFCIAALLVQSVPVVYFLGVLSRCTRAPPSLLSSFHFQLVGGGRTRRVATGRQAAEWRRSASRCFLSQRSRREIVAGAPPCGCCSAAADACRLCSRPRAVSPFFARPFLFSFYLWSVRVNPRIVLPAVPSAWRPPPRPPNPEMHAIPKAGTPGTDQHSHQSMALACGLRRRRATPSDDRNPPRDWQWAACPPSSGPQPTRLPL